MDLAFPNNKTLIISNDETKDFIEIVKSLEDSGLLLKAVSETIQNEAKEQKGGFFSMLLGTSGASLLGNILARKGMNRAEEGAIAKWQARGIVRAGYGNKKVRKTTTINKKNFQPLDGECHIYVVFWTVLVLAFFWLLRVTFRT